MTQAKKPLSHLNAQGEAQMVDVSAKAVTRRQATAEAKIVMALATLEAIEAGDVLAVGAFVRAMSQEEAERILQKRQSDEKELLKQAKRMKGTGKKVKKDW